MAQIVEYTLVVLVSTLFAGASLGAYVIYSKFESGVQLQAGSAELGGLAREAAGQGHSSGSLYLPQSTLACSGSTLVLYEGGSSATQAAGAPCSFSLGVSAGVHTFEFHDTAGSLSASVT
ncbi:MAG TPA: hypothetical protein VEB67_02370 [Nitrososphaerales archaeon]|nr:hypothetical protein [Nitrososphaerales archaeon]